MSTFSDTLLSGVPFVGKSMLGKHQRILTEQKARPFMDKMNEILADCLVSVGDVMNPSVEFVENMLAGDRRKALTAIRQFTMSYDPVFKFKWKYLSDEKKMECEIEKEVDLKEGFPQRPYYKTWENYSTIERRIMLKLPDMDEEIQWTMMDGKGEAVAQKLSKAERSSHAPIQLRNPIQFQKVDSGTEPVPIKLNLDKLSYRDIETLRKDIKEKEGQVDTELMFEHPESEHKPPSEKNVVVDLLGVTAFFFPSEAI